LEEINKIDKPLANLTKRRRKKMEINKIRNEIEKVKQMPRKSRDSSGTT
jgi:hypothetical protein